MPADVPLVHLFQPAREASPRPPLLLLLHGIGSNEHDLFSLADVFDPRLAVVSARAPLTLGSEAYAWFHTQFQPGGPVIAPAEAEASREVLLRFLAAAPSAFGTDPARTFLLGFSQGAIMTMSVALTQPHVVAGAVMLSGRVLPEIRPRLAATEALAGLSVFVGHGVFDEKLPIRHARETRELLASLPVELTYREYQEGHTISQEELSDLNAWLTARLDGAAAG